MAKKKLAYEGGKTLVFDDETGRGVVVDSASLAQDIAFLREQIAALEAVQKSQKKLADWAAEIYPKLSGLDELRRMLAEKEALQ